MIDKKTVLKDFREWWENGTRGGDYTILERMAGKDAWVECFERYNDKGRHKHAKIAQEKVTKKIGMDAVYTMWYACPDCGNEYTARFFVFCPDCGIKLLGGEEK